MAGQFSPRSISHRNPSRLKRGILLAATCATFAMRGDLPAQVRGLAEPTGLVTVHRNLKYRPREPGELLPIGNLLDVYLPKSKTDFPVILLIHGGAWVAGDKSLDFIPLVARRFAQQGFGVVAANYRLSPLVRHPAHIEDVAKALAWTVNNIARYGGRANTILLVGHSAGGHLVSLAITDTQFIRREGVSPDVIRAVVGVSGVYQVSDLTVNAIAPGLRLASHAAVVVSPFALAFGTDAEVWRQASPQSHVQNGLPPFLLVTAKYDLPTLTGMAENFHAELKAHDVETQWLQAPWRGHATNFWQMARADDATFRAVVDFLKAHSD